MKAMMGHGNESWDIVKTFIQKFVKPNTLYAESGPVIETPPCRNAEYSGALSATLERSHPYISCSTGRLERYIF